MHVLRKNGNTLYRVSLIVFVFLTLLGFVGTAFANIDAKYTPLVGIPGVTDLNENTSLPEYINAIYIVLITVGALWGVIKIVFAGVKYSLSDIVTDKGDAKDDIKGVLLGLVLLLLPWVILNEIYPNLTNLNILQPGSGGGGGSQIQTTGALNNQWDPPTGTTVNPCDTRRNVNCVVDCVNGGGRITSWSPSGEIVTCTKP